MKRIREKFVRKKSEFCKICSVCKSSTQVVVGIVEFPGGSKHSRQKLSDIESLLINKLQPSGNIACRKTRISRPGMTVTCCGEWHYPRKKFVDN